MKQLDVDVSPCAPASRVSLNSGHSKGVPDLFIQSDA